MNNSLLEALRENNSTRILKIVSESGVVENRLVEAVTDEDVAQSIVTACDYITQAIGTVNSNSTDWSTLFNTAQLKVGLDNIKDNPAIITFTRVMIMILYVLLQDD